MVSRVREPGRSGKDGLVALPVPVWANGNQEQLEGPDGVMLDLIDALRQKGVSRGAENDGKG